MDTFEREAGRERGEAQALGNQKSYDYGGRSAKELAQMVEDRDRKIAILEKHIHEHNITVPNWPKCYPMLHIDIDGEVPARRRRFCHFVHIAWYLTGFILICNLIALFIAAQSENKDANVDNDKWEQSQWLSVGYLLGIPVSFPLWFYSTYSALSTGKQLRYVVSLVGLAVGVLGSTFAIVGILGYGGCGVFTVVRAKDDKGNTAFLCTLAVLVMWCCICVFLVFAFLRQWRYKRQDAKIALMSEAAANMMVRAAIDNL